MSSGSTGSSTPDDGRLVRHWPRPRPPFTATRDAGVQATTLSEGCNSLELSSMPVLSRFLAPLLFRTRGAANFSLTIPPGSRKIGIWIGTRGDAKQVLNLAKFVPGLLNNAVGIGDHSPEGASCSKSFSCSCDYVDGGGSSTPRIKDDRHIRLSIGDG